MRHVVISSVALTFLAGCAIPGSSSPTAPGATTSAGASSSRSTLPPEDEPALSADEQHWRDVPRLSNVQVALLHARLSKTRPSYDAIAWLYPDIASDMNAISRHDGIVRARAEIAEQEANLPQARTFVVTVTESFNPDHYDFERKRWLSSSFRDSAGVFWDASGPASGFHTTATWSLVFENLKRFTYIPVSEDSARELNRRLSPQLAFDIEWVPVSTKTENMRPFNAPRTDRSGYPCNTIIAQIVRLRVRPQDSPNVIADIVVPEQELHPQRHSSAPVAKKP